MKATLMTQCVGYNIFCTFFMLNHKAIILNQQGPAHEALVVIVHAREKHKRVVICIHDNRQAAEANVHLELYQIKAKQAFPTQWSNT